MFHIFLNLKFLRFFRVKHIFSLARYHIFFYFIRPEIGSTVLLLVSGKCEEVPKIPTPPRKIRMCLLPGSMDKMRRLNKPFFQVDIVECEAYEICMPHRPDDTSNIGGSGLGYFF